MLNKVVIVCIALVTFICGCGGNEPVAEIVSEYPVKGTSPVRPSPRPKPTAAVPSYEPDVPSGWMPLSWAEKDWTAIVIHHSASRTGNASIFDNWHREGRGWNGVGYDFVIGNGTDSSDGPSRSPNAGGIRKSARTAAVLPITGQIKRLSVSASSVISTIQLQHGRKCRP